MRPSVVVLATKDEMPITKHEATAFFYIWMRDRTFGYHACTAGPGEDRKTKALSEICPSTVDSKAVERRYEDSNFKKDVAAIECRRLGVISTSPGAACRNRGEFAARQSPCYSQASEQRSIYPLQAHPK
jgi:hypothetical protein